MPLKVVNSNPDPDLPPSNLCNASNELKERHASPRDWTVHKNMIGPRLRAKGDAPPRMVKSGSGPPLQVCSNVRRAIAGTKLGIVRGYKIFVAESVDKFNEDWRIVFKAVPHVVVLGQDGAYRCVTQDAAGASDFLFLPSSRMSAELPNAELLSGNYMLCSVVGGHMPQLTEQICNSFHFVFDNPENAKPERNVHALLPKELTDWLNANRPDYDIGEVARAIGLPNRDPCEAHQEWEANDFLHEYMKQACLIDDESERRAWIERVVESWVLNAENEGTLSRTTPALREGRKISGSVVAIR
jgi:hypothetical protein